jgi:hypothetical protein
MWSTKERGPVMTQIAYGSATPGSARDYKNCEKSAGRSARAPRANFNGHAETAKASAANNDGGPPGFCISVHSKDR